jgi:hypothetical protein
MTPDSRTTIAQRRTVIVRCQLFSGRRDPQWTLSPPQRAELLAMLGAIRGRTLLKPPGTAGGLGYRGFLITSGDEDLAPEESIVVEAGIIDVRRLALNLVDDQNRVERWLLASAGSAMDAALRQRVATSIRFLPPMLPMARPAQPRARARRSRRQRKAPACKPDFEPSKWNGAAHVGVNTCYNYATDVRTDHSALPGEGSGSGCCGTDASVTCGKVGAKVVQDGLVKVTSLNATNPANSHYLALVVEPAGTPGRDFHFYRRDCDGTWSHKVGNAPARNWDESFNTITDPEACDRGPYTVFCGYYRCNPSIVTIF